MNERLAPDLRLVQLEGTPPQTTPEQLSELASTYAEVFAGAPWHEVTRCSTEGSFFDGSTEVGGSCPDCTAPLIEAYPQADTEANIRRELDRPEAVAYLLEQKDQLKGFSWGFAYESPEDFAEEKWQTPQMREKVIRALGANGIRGAFFYLSESGIVDNPAVRGRGISAVFHAKRLEVAAEKGLPAVQRTSSQGPMYRTSLKSGMQQIIGPEVVVDPERRTFTETGKIVGDVVDSENEPRVLFVRHSDGRGA